MEGQQRRGLSPCEHGMPIGICPECREESTPPSIKDYIPPAKEEVNHPSRYGGKNNPYEAIKVIEAWELNFNLGNTAKYIARAGKKDDILQELEKAAWYLNREIENIKKGGYKMTEQELRKGIKEHIAIVEKYRKLLRKMQEKKDGQEPKDLKYG